MNVVVNDKLQQPVGSSYRKLLVSVVPTTLIAIFYAMVALHWWSELSAAVSAIRRSDDSAAHILAAAHAASTAFFFALLAVITVVRKQPLRRERRLKGWLLPLAVMAAMGVVGAGDPRSLPLPISFVATSLVVGGTVFTLYALRFLGRHFGVVSDVRGLVTSGPYAWVRHPLYAGEAITLAGVAISVGTPLSVAAFVIGLSLQAWRARTEEEALSAVFPEYAHYSRRTPMLIPGLRIGGSGNPSSTAGD